MVSEKYIELNLNDDRAGKVAEVLSNKTAKKILNVLAEEELSQGDIAKKLGIGSSNVDYTMKKLIDSGLVEKTSSFFWSVKGKKIPTYKLANKKIIISTKNSFKSLVFSGVVGGLIFGLGKLGINYYNNQVLMNNIPASNLAYESAPVLMAKASESAPTLAGTINYFTGVSLWIIIGLIVGSFGFVLYLKLKQMKGGSNKI